MTEERKKEILKKVEEIRSSMGGSFIHSELPQFIKDNEEGLEIVAADLKTVGDDKEVVGATRCYKRGDSIKKSIYRSYVDKNEKPKVKIFALAHEYAHYLFHKEHLDSGRLFFLTREKEEFDFGDDDEQEREANYFAMNLLMPREKFEYAERVFESDMNKISRYFGVPVDIADRRAECLMKESRIATS
jgi:Zn-dependent peptidase ImmA (M78 family)